ncbi:hypothetical protein [Luteibacter sp. OK325]|uniref:hypothetical protein n=1 Tax=Luteibacter sp. OK325 TaxID=2135670 RepID=UPI0011B2416E|nr:hypothetical protein [Luteibacter sp. OK325]
MAHAGKIEIEVSPGGPGIEGTLFSDSKLFADAFRTIIVEKKLAAGGNSGRWGKLRSDVHSATVSRMTYSYSRNGRTFTRTYHARSGPAMEVVLARNKLIGVDGNAVSGTSGTSGTSGSESEGSRPYSMSEEDIAKDFSERKYYPADTPTDIRVRNLAPVDDGIVRSSGKEAAIHSADAELKIFRQIEKDVAEGAVEAGGTLTGYVSKAVCPSCTAAAENLAEEYGIDGTIHQLVEPGAEVGLADDTLLQSKEASTQLKLARKDYARTNLQRNAVTAPEEGGWLETKAVQSIEAEEAARSLAQPCGE